MPSLNEFQIECEKALIDALASPIVERSISGIKESFIVGYLPNTELKIYIYLDGAEVVGNSVDERFESADYDSLADLQRDFISKAVELREKYVWTPNKSFQGDGYTAA